MKEFKRIVLIPLCSVLLLNIQAQEEKTIELFLSYQGDAIYGATVNWLNTNDGAISDEIGMVTLDLVELPAKSLISHAGFKADTIDITPSSPHIMYYRMTADKVLEEVEIRKKRKSNYVSSLESIKTEVISSAELNKAACCDLSESFQSNASVDVGDADAVSGSKEITFLGLDGVYVQQLINNIPAVRGLASSFGMNYIPGPWIKQIAVSKGGGSVVNGYESMTGSISLNFKDINDEKLNLDLFGNHLGRVEANVLGQIKVGEKWSTGIGGNFGILKHKFDNNGDSFLDQTLFTRYNLLNKWDKVGEKTMQHIAIQGIYENRENGQMQFYDDEPKGNAYGIGIETKHINGYFKNGFRFEEKPFQSAAIVLNGFYHNEQSFFGNNVYDGEQYSFNGSGIFQTIIKTTEHKISTGGNVLVEHYDETLNDVSYVKKEYVPGVFFEYTYNREPKFTLVAGLRYDQHNLFGAQISPRLHVRYAPVENTTLRMSASRGFRSANLFAENKYLLASSRAIVWNGEPLQDAVWNYGINLTQSFNLKNRDGYFSVDLYRTDFTSKTLVDLDQSTQEIIVQNVSENAFANSIQVELAAEVANGLDLKIAYKFDDARAVYANELSQNPMTTRHKGLFTASYMTPNEQWQFDWITKVHGKHRLVYNELAVDRGEFSPAYVSMNVQVNKYFENGIEIYIGGENISNYTQADPIIGGEDPYQNGFDASQVWGPIVGGILYGGLRYKLK